MADLKAKDVLARISDEQKVDLYNRYALNLKGSYMYREGDSYKIVGNAVSSVANIETAVINDRLSVSDFFIAYVVTILGAADLETIKLYLSWYHKEFPDKLVPSKITESALEGRLKEMSQVGLIRMVKILGSDEKAKATFYCSSDVGAKSVKRRLDILNMPYDGAPLLDRPSRVYRRLLVSRVVARMVAYSPAHLEFNCFSDLRSVAIKRRYNVYAQITATDSDNNKTLLLVEPVLFEYDKLLKTKSEHLDDIRERLRFLDSHISTVLEAEGDKRIHDDVKVVFIISDYDALTELVKMVLDTSITLAEHSYYTSDRLISLNGSRLYRAFYGVSFIDDGNGGKKPRIDVARNENLFGVDDKEGYKLTEEIVVKLGYTTG